VISTLGAFGGAASTVDNLRALRAAGATVLYGTDFGNTRDTGIDREELRLLGEAGLDGAAILAAGTSTPAKVWAWTDLGGIEVGKAASLLVLDADPLVDASTLPRPVTVWIDGLAR
jgi:imidazolonepropionase-like amidohydrolase